MEDNDDFFLKNGYYEYPGFFDKQICKNLLDEVAKTRNCKTIFLSESEFKKQKKQIGCNPRPGRNLAGKLDTNFVFGSEKFQKELSHIMGNKYRILDYTLVMGVPRTDIPKWINDFFKEDSPQIILGKYVKEEYRDMTYLSGIDFHQDIIDFPYRNSNFLTAYVYLDEVDELSSPLYILPTSHTLGATVFPHDLNKIEKKTFLYKNSYGDSIKVNPRRLTGEGGSLYLWHSNLLHGTQPNLKGKPRISLRILVEKNSTEQTDCPLDKVNKLIKGSLTLMKTRRDIEEQLRGNFINQNV